MMATIAFRAKWGLVDGAEEDKLLHLGRRDLLSFELEARDNGLLEQALEGLLGLLKFAQLMT